jgi:DNA helicase HerA-like ATPase
MGYRDEEVGRKEELRTEAGVILGTKPATPSEFFIAVKRDFPLQLDDTVWTETKIISPEDGREIAVKFYGILDSVERSYEGLDFDSDMYYIHEIPVEERHIARVKITKIEPEILIPPKPGAPVFLARGEDFLKAVGADTMKRKIPAGLSLAQDEVVYIDLDFVDGEKGAHICISGVSGVATKTSYGIFLLHEIMRESKRKRGNGYDKKGKYAAIIFNVKGEDLLFIDKPNKKFYEEMLEEEGKKWRKISEEIYSEFIANKKGFSVFEVKIFAPPKKNVNVLVPDVSQRPATEVRPLALTFFDFAKYQLIRYCISEDDSEQIRGLVEQIADLLYSKAEETEEKIKQGVVSKSEFDGSVFWGQNKRFRDLEEFLNYLMRIWGDERDILYPKIKNYHYSTFRAFLSRFHNFIKFAGHIITPKAKSGISDKGGDFDEVINLTPGSIYVIHIGNLPDLAQRFLVGSMLSRIFNEQEKGAERRVIVFLDELSKYAPREGSSPIKSILEDIAERGRSLGIILIGAQQSARTVSKKIIMNSSIKVVGRMSPEEVYSPEYEFLSAELKKRLTVFQPGRLILYQPSVFAPLPVKFPFPFWATRSSEVMEDSSKSEKIEEELKKIYEEEEIF